MEVQSWKRRSPLAGSAMEAALRYIFLVEKARCVDCFPPNHRRDVARFPRARVCVEPLGREPRGWGEEVWKNSAVHYISFDVVGIILTSVVIIRVKNLLNSCVSRIKATKNYSKPLKGQRYRIGNVPRSGPSSQEVHEWPSPLSCP